MPKMEIYTFNANAAKHYKNILSGGNMDRYIYNSQDGNGMGSFFGPILKAIIPIAKSIGSTLFGLAKPAAKAVAREGIKGMATAGFSSLGNKTVETVQRSRKRNSASKIRSAKRRR